MSWSRVCSMCGCDMPRAALRCAACKVEHDRQRLRQWRAENPDKVKSQEQRSNKARYERDPDKRKQQVREYVAANRERTNAYWREWRAANPDKHRAAKAKCRAARPELYAEATRRRQARKRAATVETVDYEAVAERDGWTCQLCGQPVDRNVRGRTRWSVSFDHIVPLARGGEHGMANVQLAHYGCNSRKGVAA